MVTETAFDVGTMRVRILDDGVFITDAGNLFGGTRKMRIRGAMHAVLVESGQRPQETILSVVPTVQPPPSSRRPHCVPVAGG